MSLYCTYNYESQYGNNEGKYNLTLKLSIKIEPTAARYYYNSGGTIAKIFN